MRQTEEVDSKELQARRLEETGEQIAGLLNKPGVAQKAHIGPGETEWSILQILGHMTEMIPFWINQCFLLIKADGEPPRFGRELDAPVRLNGINRGAAGELNDLIYLLDKEIKAAAYAIRNMSDEERKKKGIHIRHGEITVAEAIEKLVVAHAAEHLEQLREVCTE